MVRAHGADDVARFVGAPRQLAVALSATSFRIMVVTVLLGLTLLIPASALAAAERETINNGSSEEEAWYYRYKRPSDTVGGLPDDPSGKHLDEFADSYGQLPTTPYARNTVRVGVQFGQPEAQLFFSLPGNRQRMAGAEVARGTVTFELFADDEGVANPEAASMQACLGTEAIVSDEGQYWGARPKYDCKVKAPLQLRKGSEPLVWTLDLAPFVKAWRAGATNWGLAVVEDPEAVAPDTTWHVAFRSIQHKDGPSIRSDLVLVTPELPEFPEFGETGPSDPGGASPGGETDFSTGTDDTFSAPAPGTSAAPGFTSDSAPGVDAYVPDAAAGDVQSPQIDVPQAAGDPAVAAAQQNAPFQPYGLSTQFTVAGMALTMLATAGIAASNRVLASWSGLLSSPLRPTARQE